MRTMRPSGTKARPYGFCGVTIASELSLPPLRRGVLANATCAITVGRRGSLLPQAEWFHEWRPRGGRSWLPIRRRRSGYLLRFTGLADFAVNKNRTRLVVHPAREVPE